MSECSCHVLKPRGLQNTWRAASSGGNVVHGDAPVASDVGQHHWHLVDGGVGSCSLCSGAVLQGLKLTLFCRSVGGAPRPAVPGLVGAPQPAVTASMRLLYSFCTSRGARTLDGWVGWCQMVSGVWISFLTARRSFSTSFSTCRLVSPSLLVRSLLPMDPWCGCFWISFSMSSDSFSKATYFLLLSAFVGVVPHPCGVKSHGGALLTAVCITSHQSARASLLTWLVRPDLCRSRAPLAYMHHDSCASVSVLAKLVLCYSACLC